MYTVKNNQINEIEIKKSRFITSIFQINNENEINKILEELKTTYKDATHYCFGYVINDIAKSSDDNEPCGTAGIPILNTLLKNNLNYCLCVVVRYFGGIKLGSGGLVRAYTKGVTEILKNIELLELVNGYLIKIEIDYNDIKQLEYILRNEKTVYKEFTDKVIIEAEIKKDKLPELEIYNPLLLKEIIIKTEF